ncbi:phage head closure protein [Acinetobacter haemolyticus]|uniref:phage head closure protein n=1 Tax=Acinetobacter haemolyticus TaxID=29430 RepID=UPI000E583508|nr:phage head closure protein [Acinetobacter haemolyticus]QDJ91873.1 head-tail adaptor protein [Acinetobacter haemolyticus]
MGLNAGDLRDRVIIQKKSGSGRDDDGFANTISWVEHANLWAKITPLSARDLFAAQAAQAKTIARMMVRYRTDIDTTMRVIYRGMIYAIDGPALNDAETGNIFSTFLLSNGVEKFNEG